MYDGFRNRKLNKELDYPDEILIGRRLTSRQKSGGPLDVMRVHELRENQSCSPRSLALKVNFFKDLQHHELVSTLPCNFD